ncbi:MAG: ATP-binding protein [Verrucomicrobia bacterium]|nr:ATP-binding protein [Verrucomicrobiota bacterium]
MIERLLKPEIVTLLSRHASVGLLGPRQAGKTTLALEIAKNVDSIYLDLESPSDRAKLADPEAYCSHYSGKLIVLDEIQRVPELFPVLRGVIDRRRRSGDKFGQFLILGSASVELLKQASESLAGRIVYRELTPLRADELDCNGSLDDLWVRGGYPDSLLSADDNASKEWRDAFVMTYLERDIPQLGPRIPAETLRRLWTMLAHQQGALLNSAKLAASLGISGQTVARYIDLMSDLFLTRRLQPWYRNVGKRLVKSQKIYVRDSGLVHALLGLGDLDAVLGHPVAGGSWEGMIVENLIAAAPQGTEACFYRTSAGAELDLVLDLNEHGTWAIEIKRSLAPVASKGFHLACDDTEVDHAFVVYPGEERYPINRKADAIGLSEILTLLKDPESAQTQ